jgi:hypothetical protein
MMPIVWSAVTTICCVVVTRVPADCARWRSRWIASMTAA